MNALLRLKIEKHREKKKCKQFSSREMQLFVFYAVLQLYFTEIPSSVTVARGAWSKTPQFWIPKRGTAPESSREEITGR